MRRADPPCRRGHHATHHQRTDTSRASRLFGERTRVHTQLAATHLRPPRTPPLGEHDDQVRRHPADHGDQPRVQAGDQHHQQADVEGGNDAPQPPELPLGSTVPPSVPQRQVPGGRSHRPAHRPRPPSPPLPGPGYLAPAARRAWSAANRRSCTLPRARHGDPPRTTPTTAQVTAAATSGRIGMCTKSCRGWRAAGQPLAAATTMGGHAGAKLAHHPLPPARSGAGAPR
jgi:hypothetical protein